MPTPAGGRALLRELESRPRGPRMMPYIRLGRYRGDVVEDGWVALPDRPNRPDRPDGLDGPDRQARPDIFLDHGWLLTRNFTKGI